MKVGKKFTSLYENLKKDFEPKYLADNWSALCKAYLQGLAEGDKEEGKKKKKPKKTKQHHRERRHEARHIYKVVLKTDKPI